MESKAQRHGDDAPEPSRPSAAAEHTAPSDAPAVEIVSAGNEVLSGDVLDTNTNRLCTLVTGLGGVVRRTVMVRDELEAIGLEIAGAVLREPSLVFTVGGLGPTSDDRTLEGVALGLGVPLELHPEAERMVREKYAEFHARGFVPFAQMNDARRKMAMLPAGARPIVNPLGGAPGVLVEVGRAALVSLPGVPEELEAIVDQSLDDLLARVFGPAHYEERALVVSIQDESAIATILRRAELDHPQVYVKSRAKVLGSARVIRVTLSARGSSAEDVEGLIAPAAEQLLAQIAAAGYGVHAESDADAGLPDRR
jgi:molybdopterin-biosynthesis enzyme MoeA-like protein